MQEQYLTQLAEVGRPVQVTTRVDANVGSYCYDVIYATRATEGGNGYERTIEYVKEFIEEVHAGDIDVILEILEGDQSTLNSHLPENREEVAEELPDQESAPQSSLNEF